MVPDLIDDVQELVNIFQENSLKTHLEQNKPKKPYREDEGDIECEDCGVIMNSVRRKHGYNLCVDCQSYQEKSDTIRKMRGE